MARVVHFEIHAEDPERAARFYRAVLGWEIRKWDGPMEYWTVRTGDDAQPGINGGMIRRRGTIDGQAVIAYVCTVDVESLDRGLAAVAEQGGMVALPKMPVPGVGWLAYVKDSEGNLLGLLESDPSAG